MSNFLTVMPYQHMDLLSQVGGLVHEIGAERQVSLSDCFILIVSSGPAEGKLPRVSFCVTEMCFFSFFTIFFIISGGFWQCPVFSFLSANPDKTKSKVLVLLPIVLDIRALPVAELLVETSGPRQVA